MMKQAYFTPETITPLALEMIAQASAGREHSAVGRSAVGRSAAALLVLDLQRYFLEPTSHAYIPSAPAILPGIQRLVDAFQQAGQPVICTRHINTAQDAGSMARWWRELLQEENPLSAMTPVLNPRGATILPKSQYDAFLDTDLQARLEQRQIRQVVISGVMTHLCCETTARAAFTRGFEVFFCVDGTATYNVDFHRASLLNLGHGFARLVRVTEILAALEINQHA